MEPWEIALEELERYKHIYPKGYTIIDSYIKPLCELLTDNGFITMHSCSAHIKAKTQNIRHKFSQSTGKWATEKGKFTPTRLANRWYVLFVPKVPVEEIAEIVNKLNGKYDYDITLEQVNDCDEIINRWVIDEDMEFNFNDQQLLERHKNIYLEFKNHFEKVGGKLDGIQRVEV